MTNAHVEDSRWAALDEYLAERETEGFRIETRTKTQAVIVKRGRLFFGQQRHVVSVDQHGVVSAVAAEPVRW
jgi:hypothetical protein